MASWYPSRTKKRRAFSSASRADRMGRGNSAVEDAPLVMEAGVALMQPPPTWRDEREGTPARVIVVASDDAWARQRYTLAHELCHALYDDAGQFIVDKIEICMS